jgi:hypothetical protein
MTRTGRVQASVLFALIGAASLILTTTTNRTGGLILRNLAPSLAWLADACVPALLASLLFYVAIRPAPGSPAPTQALIGGA